MSTHTTSRRRVITAVGLSAVGLAGTGGATVRGHTRNFRAHLSGDNEVPPVETTAQGQAIFHLTKTGDALSYKLIVANIEDVSMAHIHTAPADENGPVVAWLYPADGPPPAQIDGRFDGILAESTLRADDLVGPLAGASIDELLALFRAGEAYVNVHTATYPAGEVRGQIH